MTTTTTAIYENGVLRVKGRLGLRNHEVVILRFDHASDSIEGTRGIIRVSRQFARALTRPHRFSTLSR